MKRVLTAMFAVAVCCVGPFANADLILDLAFSDSTTSKSVNSGNSVLVDMFLVDTDASTTMSAEGLLSGGGRLFRSAGTAVVSEAAAVMAGSNAAPNWASIAPAGGQPVGTIASALAAATFPTTVGVGTTSIHIARFTLNVVGIVGDTATITADTLSGLTGNLTGPPSFADLDAVLTGGGGTFGSVDLNIVAVPEASSFVVAALLAGGCVLIYRRRRPYTEVPSA